MIDHGLLTFFGRERESGIDREIDGKSHAPISNSWFAKMTIRKLQRNLNKSQYSLRLLKETEKFFSLLHYVALSLALLLV